MIFERNEYLAAVSKAQEAANNYYHHKGEVSLTDNEYDDLVEHIRLASENFGWDEGKSLYTMVAAGTKPETESTITHNTPMLSLDKLGDVQEFVKFVEKVGEKNLVLEPKLDGVALSVIYENGVMVQVAGRGTGVEAKNVTERIKSINVKGLPSHVNVKERFEVRGELYITDSDFVDAQQFRLEEGKPVFSNPRNAVAGVMSDEKSSRIVVSFAVYDVLGFTGGDYLDYLKIVAREGFVPAIMLMPKLDGVTLFDRVEDFGRKRQSLGFLTDGIVLKCVSSDVRKMLGNGSRAPRHSKAWKYNADEKRGTTVITSIDYTVGKTGRLGMVARVKPVKLDTVVSNISLHNVKWIQERDIRVGSVIEVYRANGVIPHIDKVVSNPAGSVKWVAPVTCPQCGGEFDKSTELWRCLNPECSVLGSVLYAGEKLVLDWDGFSTAIATRLVDSGRVENVADVFSLSKRELINLSMGRKRQDGSTVILGEKVGTKVWDKIQESKKKPLANVITSLSIRKMGKTMGRRVAEHFGSMDKVLVATVEDFCQVEGIAVNKAEEYVAGFANRKQIIERLKNYNVNMVQPKRKQTLVHALKDKKVVVTGSMKGSRLENYTRDGMNELIRQHGGTPSSAVSSSTNILVCGEPGSSKYVKAKSLGKTILSPNEFAQLLNI